MLLKAPCTLANFGKQIRRTARILGQNLRRLANFVNRKIPIRREFAERRELQLEEAQNSRRSANSRWSKFASVHGALVLTIQATFT